MKVSRTGAYRKLLARSPVPAGRGPRSLALTRSPLLPQAGNMTKHGIRCAIYTRKSSEEGLDQSFNSLDAQREACRAFVISQKHEGWKVLSNRYDDGGFSGGSIDRPA